MTSTLGSLFSFKRMKNGHHPKYAYTFGLLLGALVCWMFYLFGDHLNLKVFNSSICDGASCLNHVSIFKLSLGMILYHAFLCLCLLGVSSSDNGRAFIQDGIWPIKAIIWIGTIVGCFFIPDEKFTNFWIACVFFGAIFVVFQSLIMVDFIWSLAESWLSKFEESQGCGWKSLLIGSTFFCVATVITSSALLYKFYTGEEGCGRNTFFITFNIIISIVMMALSVSPKVQEANPKSGILQAAFMSVYTSYLVASAIGSDASETCKVTTAVGKDSALSKIMLYVGIIFGVTSLCYTALSMGTSETFDAGAVEVSAAESGSKKDGEGKNDKKMDDEPVVEVSYNYSFFHFIFFLAIFYLVAVLTQWSQMEVSGGGDNVKKLEINSHSTAPAWVQVVFSWISALLYIWTLIAPILLPDRNFNF